jgi:hypothetical protein
MTACDPGHGGVTGWITTCMRTGVRVDVVNGLFWDEMSESFV